MKFHGTIGFWIGDFEVEPGIWKPRIVERKYSGDILRNTRRSVQVADKQNSDLSISNQFSILSDLYLKENLNSVKYIIWNGVKWTVTNVELSYPRINLEVGGVYNDKGPPGTS